MKRAHLKGQLLHELVHGGEEGTLQLFGCLQLLEQNMPTTNSVLCKTGQEPACTHTHTYTQGVKERERERDGKPF